MSKIKTFFNKIKRFFHSRRWLSIRKTTNRLYWLGILAIIGILVYFSVGIVSRYNNTLSWKHMDQSTVMAKQSLDMLYDKNNKSKEAKEKFMKYYHKAIKKNGDYNEDTSLSRVKEMKALLNDINIRKGDTDYNKLYAEVSLKYSLTQQYNSLFADKAHRLLNKNITPKEILNLSNTSFNGLSALFVRNHDDIFVDKYLEKFKKFSHDIDVFNELYNLFEQAISIDGSTVTLQQGYYKKLVSIYDNKKSDFNYQWKSTKFMDDIVRIMKPINEEVSADYKKYNNYLKDIEEKQNAIAQWKQEQYDFLQRIQSIRDEAIAKKAQEEADREEKDAVKRLKEKAEEIFESFIYMTPSRQAEYMRAINGSTSSTHIKDLIQQAKDEESRLIDADKEDNDDTSLKEEQSNEITKVNPSNKNNINNSHTVDNNVSTNK